MSTPFARNLEALMAREGLTQQAIADAVGVSNQLVSKWLSGEVSTPRTDKLDALAKRFGVRRPFDIMSDGGVDYLLGGSVAAESRAPYTSGARAPLYGRIAAGAPIEAMPVADSHWVDPDVLDRHPRGFYLRVEGQSMNRVLPDGCLAFVDPDAEVVSGDVAALHIDGHDATIKRVLLGSTSITLAPDSTDPGFTDTIFDRTKPGTETVTLIGRVVWFVCPLAERL